MEQKNKNIVGILLLAFGAVFLLQRLNVFPATIFFQGWWTLFLIVPAILSMSKQGVTAGNAVLLVIGVFFFIDAQGWNLQGYLMPAILIALGIGLLLKKR